MKRIWVRQTVFTKLSMIYKAERCLLATSAKDKRPSLDSKSDLKEIVDGKLSAKNKEYYEKAAEDKSQFVKDFYKFDMNVRNVKARYLNAAFDRPADQDVIVLEGQDASFEEEPKVKAVLENKDILAREKGLDDIMWNKIYELTLFHYLDMDVIYSFLAKLHIIDRWLKLDEQTGREMFRKLVGEVRGTFKGVEYSE